MTEPTVCALLEQAKAAASPTVAAQIAQLIAALGCPDGGTAQPTSGGGPNGPPIKP